jgi:hypothetical protein
MDRLNFKNVTLVMCDGTGKDFFKNEKIIKQMDLLAIFGKIKHFTFSNNESKISKIVKINKILNYFEYQNFCIYDVSKNVDTEFALFMQTDGFICNPTKFKNNFFNYDYIGAPWPKNLFKTLSPHNELVGNGGFSLRSKKLLDLCENIPEVIFNEDITICHNYRKQFEVNRCNFAPYEVAKNFSIEIQCSNDHVIEECFGFHGKAHIEKATKLLNKHLNSDEMKV